jgi:hypothetical protein
MSKDIREGVAANNFREGGRPDGQAMAFLTRPNVSVETKTVWLTHADGLDFLRFEVGETRALVIGNFPPGRRVSLQLDINEARELTKKALASNYRVDHVGPTSGFFEFSLSIAK